MFTDTKLGWAFKSPLSFAEMKKRLDATSSEPWDEGDSHYLGDYLGGALTRQAIARIYAVEGGYTVNLGFSSESNVVSQLLQMKKAKKELLEKVLPAIEASEVKSVDPLE